MNLQQSLHTALDQYESTLQDVDWDAFLAETSEFETNVFVDGQDALSPPLDESNVIHWTSEFNQSSIPNLPELSSEDAEMSTSSTFLFSPSTDLQGLPNEETFCSNQELASTAYQLYSDGLMLIPDEPESFPPFARSMHDANTLQPSSAQYPLSTANIPSIGSRKFQPIFPRPQSSQQPCTRSTTAATPSHLEEIDAKRQQSLKRIKVEDGAFRTFKMTVMAPKSNQISKTGRQPQKRLSPKVGACIVCRQSKRKCTSGPSCPRFLNWKSNQKDLSFTEPLREAMSKFNIFSEVDATAASQIKWTNSLDIHDAMFFPTKLFGRLFIDKPDFLDLIDVLGAFQPQIWGTDPSKQMMPDWLSENFFLSLLTMLFPMMDELSKNALRESNTKRRQNHYMLFMSLSSFVLGRLDSPSLHERYNIPESSIKACRDCIMAYHTMCLPRLAPLLPKLGNPRKAIFVDEDIRLLHLTQDSILRLLFRDFRIWDLPSTFFEIVYQVMTGSKWNLDTDGDKSKAAKGFMLTSTFIWSHLQYKNAPRHWFGFISLLELFMDNISQPLKDASRYAISDSFQMAEVLHIQLGGRLHAAVILSDAQIWHKRSRICVKEIEILLDQAYQIFEKTDADDLNSLFGGRWNKASTLNRDIVSTNPSRVLQSALRLFIAHTLMRYLWDVIDIEDKSAFARFCECPEKNSAFYFLGDSSGIRLGYRVCKKAEDEFYKLSRDRTAFEPSPSQRSR